MPVVLNARWCNKPRNFNKKSTNKERFVSEKSSKFYLINFYLYPFFSQHRIYSYTIQKSDNLDLPICGISLPRSALREDQGRASADRSTPHTHALDLVAADHPLRTPSNTLIYSPPTIFFSARTRLLNSSPHPPSTINRTLRWIPLLLPHPSTLCSNR